MYNEIVNSLDSISQFASSTGLERGRQLLHDMNNPEKSLKIIDVAGTNGKGSVCAYIAGILQHNGYKTGLFTSPHLDDITERIRINGIMISQEDFEEAYWYVEEHRTQEQSLSQQMRLTIYLTQHLLLSHLSDLEWLENQQMKIIHSDMEGWNMYQDLLYLS